MLLYVWSMSHFMNVNSVNFDNFILRFICVFPMECKLTKANFENENLMGSKVTAKFLKVTVYMVYIRM